jgi:hypothetical protein
MNWMNEAFSVCVNGDEWVSEWQRDMAEKLKSWKVNDLTDLTEREPEEA